MLAKGSLHLVALPLGLAAVAILLIPHSALGGLLLCALFLSLAALTANFFRDPEREVGEGVVSPADGIVSRAESSSAGAFVSIFMNIHDVHVNRAPWAGRVEEVVRLSGRHVPAYDRRADRNERVRITLETDLGRMFITQIVGVIARRIVPYVKAGQKVKKGQRIGMIRFGSRVDLMVQGSGLELRVKPGDRVKAGSSTLAVPARARTGGGDRP